MIAFAVVDSTAAVAAADVVVVAIDLVGRGWDLRRLLRREVEGLRLVHDVGHGVEVGGCLRLWQLV